MSPLLSSIHTSVSPLAEGRELKYSSLRNNSLWEVSPLAEGRELK